MRLCRYLLCCFALLTAVDAVGSTCSKGELKKYGGVAIEREHFSWSIIEHKGLLATKPMKMIEAEVYNASRDRNLGFFQLNVFLKDKTKITLSPNFSTSVSPLDTKKIRFRAPQSVLRGGKTASLSGTLFQCKEINFVPKPIIVPPKPVELSAEEIREQEIYDNCIIDLMPDGTNVSGIKRQAVLSKCRRISENPSLIERLKY